MECKNWFDRKTVDIISDLLRLCKNVENLKSIVNVNLNSVKMTESLTPNTHDSSNRDPD